MQMVVTILATGRITNDLARESLSAPTKLSMRVNGKTTSKTGMVKKSGMMATFREII